LQFRLLHHPHHGLHLTTAKPPTALRIEIAQSKLFRQSKLDARSRIGHLARDELDSAQRRLMIEQNPARRVQAEAFAVVDRYPMAIELRNTIWTAGVERRVLVLPVGLNLAEHFAGRCLIETCRRETLPDRLEHVRHADRIDVGGMSGLIPGRAYETLRGKVVDFVRLIMLNDP